MPVASPETPTRKTGSGIEVAVLSETGKREENQDWMGWSRVPWGECYTLADGMGGYKGGATASRMTVEGIERSLREQPPDVPFARALQAAVEKTNRDIYTAAQSGSPEVCRMGSTVAVALVAGRQLTVGNIGDSRVYLYRGGKLKQLTTDHTSVQRMVDAGMLRPEQARSHPDAHILSRAMGSKENAEIQIAGPLELEDGDGILLCSDGLSGYAKDQQIAGTLRRETDVQKVPQKLVRLALDCGSDDNITVQYIRYRNSGANPSAFHLYRSIALATIASAFAVALVFAVPSIRGLFHPAAGENAPAASSPPASVPAGVPGNAPPATPSPAAAASVPSPTLPVKNAPGPSGKTPTARSSPKEPSRPVGADPAKVPVTHPHENGPLAVVLLEPSDNPDKDLSKKIHDAFAAGQSQFRLETGALASPVGDDPVILYPAGQETAAGDLQSQLQSQTGRIWTRQALQSDQASDFGAVATAHPDRRYVLILIPRQKQP